MNGRPRALLAPATQRAALAAALAVATAGCAALLGPRKPRVEFEPYPPAEVVTVKNPHDHLGKPLCQRCHLPGDGGLVSPAISLCVSCHAFGHKNHPVDVVQRRPPEGLPFLEGGRVACHTCHDPHAVKATRWGLRLPFNELCMKCHGKHS